MDIHGLQKMTLLDFPGKVACTVFLAGCDLRCPFCHNSELIRPGDTTALMTDTELLAFLKKRQGLLEGVAFTGGEPLLQKELPELLREIKAMGYPVKLDTNGNHPDRLKQVLETELVDYVAMDVKNDRDKYALTCGLETMTLEKIDESIALLMNCSIEYEFRTTVVDSLHDESSFIGIGEWIRGAQHYYLQPFTDRDTVRFAGFSAPNEEKIHRYLSIAQQFVPGAQIRGMA